MEMKRGLRKKAKNDFKKIFLSWWIMQFLENLWKMWENMEILNLSQHKKEETFWCQNQIIILQISNRNGKNRDIYEYTYPFRAFDTGIK